MQSAVQAWLCVRAYARTCVRAYERTYVSCVRVCLGVSVWVVGECVRACARVCVSICVYLCMGVVVVSECVRVCVHVCVCVRTLLPYYVRVYVHVWVWGCGQACSTSWVLYLSLRNGAWRRSRNICPYRSVVLPAAARGTFSSSTTQFRPAWLRDKTPQIVTLRIRR